MFSGKTTELIRRTKRHEITQKRVLRVKYATGDSPDITTHAGIKSQAHSVKNLAEIEHLLPDYDVVGIDEGHFFQDIVEFCEKVANQGKIVIVSSLQGNF